MADPFVAEIRIVGFNFAPMGWAWCDGQLMPISQNTALFSLLGTTYGGDGKSTFALPDLQGRSPMHPGQGPGLPLRTLGEAVPASDGSLDAITGVGAMGRGLGFTTGQQSQSLVSPPYRRPALTLHFVIALLGVFPPRT
jgi:microcystin-dependent protein